MGEQSQNNNFSDFLMDPEVIIFFLKYLNSFSDMPKNTFSDEEKQTQKEEA